MFQIPYLASLALCVFQASTVESVALAPRLATQDFSVKTIECLK